ncbi:glycosyltransferase family 4 protein [Spirosoma endophyticum]|uniref:Glycosyltransferase involved in cell wall bisynthesis n=1 Tax=Spirosoma endophyticum TaxID=662367 RepID=A0A1I2CBW8_9BACT|nr:glycosyltransferase family 4 protein [Spirosoma endophyticum]SFE65160.1 Glycosyltransferase involved in cell wall bisynthesis [Spirosoma endophyticum]
MRVLIVSSTTQTSKTGVTAHYNRLLDQLEGRVESVQLITPADTPFLPKKIIGLLRKLAALFGQNGRVLWFELENFMSVWVSVRAKGADAFDLVHAQDATAGAGASLGLAKRVPVVMTCHFNDDPLTEYKLGFQLSDWTHKRLATWYRYVFNHNDSFITVSDYIKRTSAFLRPQGAVCEVIHNGVVFPTEQPRHESDDFIIISVGTLEERKNQRLLIEVADELRSRGLTRFRVWLLGEGPKRREWEQLVHEKNLQDYVHFLGFQTNVPDYLRKASLYVHTALNESWGYSITEAIASGTPVLALATGGIPEQFNRTGPGLLPVSITAAEMADVILNYQDARTRAVLAEEQLAFARNRFNLDVMIDKHLAFYTETIMGRQPLRNTLNPVVEL